MALTDTLDDLISERRIEPQLAMKILANFDRSITEVLADKVKARLTFKVLHTRSEGGQSGIWANAIL
jgi:transcription initiation factor TFIIA small subunit